MPLAWLVTSYLLLAAWPALAEDFPCPAGWEVAAQGCDPAVCVAPMGAAVIQLDVFARVDGVSPAAAFDGLEKIVSADGTPLHARLGERMLDMPGLIALRRDYAGSARGRDLRIALVLVRDTERDHLLRAVWNADQGAVLDILISASIAAWKPSPDTAR